MRNSKLLFMNKKNSLGFCFFIFMSFGVFAEDVINNDVHWGFEYDFMAPRIGGWSSLNVDAYLSHGRMKHALFFAHVNINEEHLTDESFSKDNLNAFGYRFEIFTHKEARRWSTGLLVMYSIHDVTTVHNQQDGEFGTFSVGVPLGYTWVLWDHLSINPNISILVPLNNRTVTIGIDTEDQAPWGLEPGIRIGYRY